MATRKCVQCNSTNDMCKNCDGDSCSCCCDCKLCEITHCYCDDRCPVCDYCLNVCRCKKNSTPKQVVAAISHGAHVGAADEAGNLILSIGTKILGNDKVTQFTDTPQGASITKAVLATLVIHAVDLVTEDLDQRKNVEKACELVLEAAGRDLLQPHMKDIRQHVVSLAKAGAREFKVASATDQD